MWAAVGEWEAVRAAVGEWEAVRAAAGSEMVGVTEAEVSGWETGTEGQGQEAQMAKTAMMAAMSKETAKVAAG